MTKKRLISLLLFFVSWIILSSAIAAREEQIATAVSPIYLPVVFNSTFHLEVIPFAEGLPSPTDPTDMVDPGDGRLFVAMKDGRILVIDQTGNIAPKPLLDIRNKVDRKGYEKGLLGLAVHPNYSSNGYIYVYYNSSPYGQLYSKLSRFTVVNNVASPRSEMVILQLMQHEKIHNGGAVRFGPKDGYLYVSVGDDSSGNNGNNNNAQSGASLLGKILRLDVNSEQPYAIPADNPFVNDPQVLDEIWALGLRNPWRINFDRLTGDLYIGDVGDGHWEEIDFQPAASAGGENYGWPCYEGPEIFLAQYCGEKSDYVKPYFYYDHNNPNRSHCAVIGGTVYRGTRMPEMFGQYFFADYCAGRLYSLGHDPKGAMVVSKWKEFDLGWQTIAERSDGELFMSASNTDTIYQIAPRGNK